MAISNEYYEYPHPGWWHTKERIAKNMDVFSLNWSYADCCETAEINPETEGKYHDEASVYWRELKKRGNVA